MSNDMFPQGFIDMMEGAKWFLVDKEGRIEGPFDSDREAADVRDSKDNPEHWKFRRSVSQW